MYIKVYFKGNELDVIGNIDAVRVVPGKRLLIAYRGETSRSLFLDDIEKIILKEDEK